MSEQEARRRAGQRGFGVAGALPHDIVRVLAPAAEEAGYRTFWVNDTPNGDGLASLRVAAEVTGRIGLGIGVIPLDRQPAAAIARRVIDLELPADRLLLGVGSGDPRGGIERVRSGVRTLDELGDWRVVVGALGPRMCAVAGEAADGVLLNWLAAAYVEPSAAIVEAAARKASRPQPLIVGYVRTALGDAARKVFAAEAARYAGYAAYAANFSRMGTPAEETAVTGGSASDIQAGLGPYASQLDETVIRAITGEETAEAYLALLEAAAPIA